MLGITFIGKKNKTNIIIFESIESNFDADIHFTDPEVIFSTFPEATFKDKHLVIVDLNTSSGLGNAPSNISNLSNITPEIPILILDHLEDEKFHKLLIRAGASGIICTAPPENVIIDAINELLSGNTFFNNSR